MVSSSTPAAVRAASIPWGTHGVLGFLPSPRGKKMWAEAVMADHPQHPLRRLLPLLPKMAALLQMLFLLCLPQPISPTGVTCWCGEMREYLPLWHLVFVRMR